MLQGTASFRLPWALQLIPGLVLGSLMFIFPGKHIPPGLTREDLN